MINKEVPFEYTERGVYERWKQSNLEAKKMLIQKYNTIMELRNTCEGCALTENDLQLIKEIEDMINELEC